MSVTPPPRPAPGRLDLVRQFLNTADLEDGTDQLDTSADARRWLREHGLAARAGVMSEPDRRHLIQIREGLRSLAFANNGSPLPPAELRRLNRLTAAASITPAFTGNNQITLVATQADAVSAILAIVYESIRDRRRLSHWSGLTPHFLRSDPLGAIGRRAGEAGPRPGADGSPGSSPDFRRSLARSSGHVPAWSGRRRPSGSRLRSRRAAVPIRP